MPGDVIFVYHGDGTTRGQNQGLRLKAGQRLIGEGSGLDIPEAPEIPAGEPPVISNRHGDGLILADGVFVSGVVIRKPEGAGVSGREIGPVRIQDVRVVGAGGDGILVENVEDVSLTRVQVEAAADGGVRAVSIGGLEVLSCTFTKLGSGAIQIFAAGDGDASLKILDCTISDSFGAGVLVAQRDRSVLEIDITGNEIRSCAGGIVLKTDDHSSLHGRAATNTIIDQSSARGIEVRQDESSQIDLRLEGNTVADTGYDGIFVEGRDDGAVRVFAIANTVSQAGRVGGCPGEAATDAGHGIRIRARGTSHVCVELENNDSSSAKGNCAGYGLSAEGESSLKVGAGTGEVAAAIGAANQGSVRVSGEIGIAVGCGGGNRG